MADSDLELDEEQTLSKSHTKLINDVGGLDLKQRIKKVVINEPTSTASEFNLVKSGITNKKVLKSKLTQKVKTEYNKTKRFLQLQKEAKTLSKPLEKPVADRIKRTVGYEKTKQVISKWDGIVARNRTIGHITFPLVNHTAMKMDPQYQMVDRCKLKSDLEKEFEKLEPPKEVKVVDQQAEEYKLTKEELLEKHREAAKLRAQESYKAAKARRQKKIKSKKFHRIQKKQKLKAEIKEFEELQKTDPEAALEKLELLGKVRAKERMTLRHKNTGQWAKNLQVRAKYDVESRQALAQQLAISKELTQKIQKADDSDDDDDEMALPPSIPAEDKDNPWMNKKVTSNEIDEFVSTYRKFWDEKHKNENTTNGDQPEEKEKDAKQELDEKKSSTPAIPIVNPVESVTITECKDEVKVKSKKSKKNVNITESKLTTDKTSKESVTNGKEQKKGQKRKASGTSKWAVESEESNESSNKNYEEDLEDLFDDADKNMQELLDSKIKLMQNELVQTAKTGTKPTKKKKKGNESEDYLEKLGLKPERLRPTIDEPMMESSNDKAAEKDPAEATKSISQQNGENKSKENEKPKEDATVEVKSQYIKSQMPSLSINDALDDSDTEENQHEMISEAFADDDAVTDFRKEKETEINKGQTKDIDLTLPGWGAWGGKDIKVSARKRKKFIVKMPKADKRKDENKGNVIIIEEKDAKIRKHLVSDVPFPFKNVKDFEANLRAPIGRDFVPEKVHRKLTRPAVKTKMGKIIEPMDETALVKEVNKRRKFMK